MSKKHYRPRDVPAQLDDLIVLPSDPLGAIVRRAEKWAPLLGNLLADNECQHGRLPTDPTPACGCWPEEHATAVPDPITYHRVTVLVPHDDYGPDLAQLAEALDTPGPVIVEADSPLSPAESRARLKAAGYSGSEVEA